MAYRLTNAYYFRCDHGRCGVVTPLVDLEARGFDDEVWTENLTTVGGWRIIPAERLIDWMALCPEHAHLDPPSVLDDDPHRDDEDDQRERRLELARSREQRARYRGGRPRQRALSRPPRPRP